MFDPHGSSPGMSAARQRAPAVKQRIRALSIPQAVWSPTNGATRPIFRAVDGSRRGGSELSNGWARRSRRGLTGSGQLVASKTRALSSPFLSPEGILFNHITRRSASTACCSQRDPADVWFSQLELPSPVARRGLATAECRQDRHVSPPSSLVQILLTGLSGLRSALPGIGVTGRFNSDT